jgi:hypothetical protein
VRWCRERAPNGDGRCSLLFWSTTHGSSQADGEFPPVERPGEESLDVFREGVDLVRAVRAEETDPRNGGWLFLRVETTAEGATIERRYDSWPEWYPVDSYSGPGRDELLAEMRRRAERWRPSWTSMLDPEIAFE